MRASAIAGIFKLMTQSLFDKYGGVPTVTLIVRDFYKRVLKRPNLRRYFVNVPMERLVLHQIAFVSMAMGKSPHDYSGRSMREAHEGLRITTASFDLTVELLQDALVAAKIDARDITSIVAEVNKLKNDIVGH